MTGAQPGAVRWTQRSGAWLAIGSSPAALVLGAGLAARHGAGVPVLTLVLGLGLMAVLLAGQGMLGLAPPHGEGRTLTELAPAYLGTRSNVLLSAVLAAAMVGWFGFNVGLGGAALGALLGAPDAAGALLLAAGVGLLSTGGMARWNGAAVVATVAALVLATVVALRFAVPVSPVALRPPGAAAGAMDLAALVGYVAVFGVRAPDFSVGLPTPGDLVRCVGLLLGAFTVMLLLGSLLHLSTGSTDLVATLAGPGGAATGNLLVAAAVVGPAFTTTYSGGLALQRLLAVPPRAAVMAVALPGAVLAALRFDRLLLPWLSLLAAVLPALVVPMATEALRRRRGQRPRMVPLWTWAPASAAASAATVLGVRAGPLLAIALAGAATAGWVRADPAGRDGPASPGRRPAGRTAP